jgi:hypothetical protein
MYLIVTKLNFFLNIIMFISVDARHFLANIAKLTIFHEILKSTDINIIMFKKKFSFVTIRYITTIQVP